MRRRAAQILFWTFLVLYTGALTWPGLTVANRIRPFVLGLPFVFFWVGAWVFAGLVVFWIMDLLESAERRSPSPGPDAAGADG